MYPLIFLSLFHVAVGYVFTGDLQECINSHRIIGGACASITDRPFQALLFIRDDPKCGASIISKRWILTAGHCVRGVSKKQIKVGAGSSKVKGLDMRYYEIEKIVIHENYFINSSIVENDIALLRTSVPIKFDETVKPIILKRTQPKVGDKTTVSGFGVTSASLDMYTETSEYLMYVDGKVVEMNLCKSIMRKAEPTIKISAGSFCAGNLKGGKDSCQGDSGGPITIGNVLAGVVSWGLGCAEKMMPAFYTDVSYYHDWISRHMAEH